MWLSCPRASRTRPRPRSQDGTAYLALHIPISIFEPREPLIMRGDRHLEQDTAGRARAPLRVLCLRAPRVAALEACDASAHRKLTAWPLKRAASRFPRERCDSHAQGSVPFVRAHTRRGAPPPHMPTARWPREATCHAHINPVTPPAPPFDSQLSTPALAHRRGRRSE